MKRYIVVTLIAAILVTSGQVIARRGVMSRMGGTGPGHLMMMANELDLTDEQWVTLRKVMKTVQEETTPFREQMYLLRGQIHEVLDDETFNEMKVRTIAELQTRIRTEMMVIRIRNMHEFRKHLTPEQRERMKALRSAHKRFPTKDGQ